MPDADAAAAPGVLLGSVRTSGIAAVLLATAAGLVIYAKFITPAWPGRCMPSFPDVLARLP
jgi:hypothetical protein